jgi:hypothetical protein
VGVRVLVKRKCARYFSFFSGSGYRDIARNATSGSSLFDTLPTLGDTLISRRRTIAGVQDG